MTLLADMEQLDEFLEPGTTMGCITKETELSLYAYFMRCHSISLDTLNPYNHSAVIIEKEMPFDSMRYVQKNLNTGKLSLLLRKGH